MTTERERYNNYRTADIEQRFNKWNEEQEESSKIRIRLPFTIEFPVPRLLKIEEKAKKDKDGKDFIDRWRPYKMLSATGQEIPYKVQSPTVIAKRGLCVIDTGSGKILSIPCTYDMRNPEHEQFLNQYEAKVAMTAYYEVLRNPGNYAIDSVDPITEFNQDVISSQEFQVALATVKAKFSKFARFPKKSAKVYDTKSPLRTIFYTPTNYLPKNESETGSSMRCLVNFGPGNVREYSIGEIQKLCSGITVVDGKEVKGTPLGFECSPELQIIKLHIGSQISNKTCCPAVFITRFQQAPRTDTQEEKVKYLTESGIEADSYSVESNLQDMLEGLKVTQNKPPTVASGFNVMANISGDSNVTVNSTITSTEGSFLSMADKQNNSKQLETISTKNNDFTNQQGQQFNPQQQLNQSQNQFPYTKQQGDAYVEMASTLPAPMQQQTMQFPSMNGLSNGPPSIPGLGMGMSVGIPGLGGLVGQNIGSTI